MTVFCAHCETACSERALVCPACGHPLFDPAAADKKVHGVSNRTRVLVAAANLLAVSIAALIYLPPRCSPSPPPIAAQATAVDQPPVWTESAWLSAFTADAAWKPSLWLPATPAEFIHERCNGPSHLTRFARLQRGWVVQVEMMITVHDGHEDQARELAAVALVELAEFTHVDLGDLQGWLGSLTPSTAKRSAANGCSFSVFEMACADGSFIILTATLPPS